ncbi:MAG: DUF359 domain-containing protein [Candidatus Lokiarchaeota archaeon]|nr:DUF359 domain-containing protein [Candidatus Lokiarchaeota archaeon]MBD3337700.1 DUF359 domain-containing protein [Candidatus Lokiarchaeota archaeon]
MDKNLKISKENRHRFTQPLGRLISGDRNETIKEVVASISDIENTFDISIYCVGDIVTKDFLANLSLRKFIKLCIIDEKTQREHIRIDSKNFFEEIIEFENPAGTISQKSWDILEKIIASEKRTLLNVTEGEEDLLVLPLVALLPLENKHLVFYGQPPITDSKISIPEGLVFVDVNKRIQKLVQKYLSLMDKT